MLSSSDICSFSFFPVRSGAGPCDKPLGRLGQYGGSTPPAQALNLPPIALGGASAGIEGQGGRVLQLKRQQLPGLAALLGFLPEQGSRCARTSNS